MRFAAALLAILIFAAPAGAQAGLDRQVREIVANTLMVPEADVTDDKSFEELGIDDESFLTIIGTVEETFDVSVADEDIAGFRTVGDVIEFVKDAHE